MEELNGHRGFTWLCIFLVSRAWRKVLLELGLEECKEKMQTTAVFRLVSREYPKP